jgi:Protein of unknown function (DUF2948)
MDVDLRKPLKLLAKDLEDLQILAAHLQDSLMPLVAMVYEPSDKMFTLLANRFCWEHPGIEHEGAPLYHRVHTGVCFHNVGAVRHKGFSRKGEQRTLNLLTMHGENKGGIHMVFSEGHEIRVETEDLRLYMGDLHVPWPTRSRPTHLHEHLDQLRAAGEI